MTRPTSFSLRRQLLVWLLLPQLVLWLMGGLLAFRVALTYAEKTIDQSLSQSVRSLSRQVKPFGSGLSTADLKTYVGKLNFVRTTKGGSDLTAPDLVSNYPNSALLNALCCVVRDLEARNIDMWMQSADGADPASGS